MTEKLPQHTDERSNEGTPFRESLVPGAYGKRRLNTLQGVEGTIVREWPIGDAGARVEERERFAAMERIFDRLHERYGFRFPARESVMGKNEKGDTVMFTITDRIEGANLALAEKFPPKAREKIEAFYESVAAYIADVYNEGGVYWSDFKNENVVWGHAGSEAEDSPYIVDTDPHTREFHRSSYEDLTAKERRDNFEYYEDVRPFLDEMRRIEVKFDPPARFERARQRLKGLLDRIPADIKERYGMLHLNPVESDN